ncbi:uncharacterized protein ACIBXB_000331 [Morphnus guianensis]
MRLSAATWSRDDSELNLAPGQVALSSANCRAQRLGGCNNHLKGEIKAPLNGTLCSRPHLMLCGLFKPRRGRRFKCLPPQPGRLHSRTCDRCLRHRPRDPAPAEGRVRRVCLVCVVPPPASPRRPHPVPAAALRDREGADRSSSPGHEAEAGGGAVPGRPRTKFSAAQLQELERSFREQRYIGASEKRRLAAALNLSQSQIKTWFQNRRMKFKRQTQDARVEALFSGLFLPYRCYPDIATSSYSQGMDVNVSSTSTVSLHPAMPSPALLLPSVPAPSLQPVLPSPALLLPPSPGLSCYSSVIPAMTLTDDHKRLRFQPYLPSC